MTIWLLALVLLASVAGVGYRQGAVRAVVSLIGIFFALRLAGWFAGLIKSGLVAIGLTNPALAWLLAPFVVFVVVLSVFKAIGFAAHRQVHLHYKYKAGDLRYALWQRLNARLGLCVGVVNGTVYLALISSVLYAFSYWTVQIGTADDEPTSVKLLNRLGRDLQSTGLTGAAKAMSLMPAVYYDAADLAGLIYNNPLLEARLSRYPSFLILGERPEFQDLGQDEAFREMRFERKSVTKLLGHPKAQAILKNPDLLKLIWDVVAPDLQDAQAFLETGKSAKYDDEKILGRWTFDVNGAVAAFRRAKPDVSSAEALRFKRWTTAAFAKAGLLAMPDHQVVLKNMPPSSIPAGAQSIQLQTFHGQWKNADGQYELSLSVEGKVEEMKVQIDGDRLTILGGIQEMVFAKED